MVSDKGEYAFMNDHSQLKYIAMKDCNNFLTADCLFNIAGLAFAIAADKPYKQEISYK